MFVVVVDRLAQMLTTRYIEPMREEVAAWSDKLKGIGEIFELWLEVQELWLGAENIFNNPSASKEISSEAKRFIRVDKTWLKSQRQSSEIRNVLQCCLGEPPKKGILKEMQKELEICNKSIALYLDRKRLIFPRFYFLTNRTLISAMSRQDSIVSVQPHFRSIFNGIRELRLGSGTHVEHARTNDEPVRVDARGTLVIRCDFVAQVTWLGDARLHGDSLPSSASSHEIVEVISDDGECMRLHRSVALHKSVEQWLCRLQESVTHTIRLDLCSCLKDIDNGLPYEELVAKVNDAVHAHCPSRPLDIDRLSFSIRVKYR
jgi:hypothetical protein